MRPDVPLRRRLLVRLLVGALLIAAVSTGATAWLASQTTVRALNDANERSFGADSRIYDSLVGYGADHRSWAGVDSALRRAASGSGLRAVLTDVRRRRRLAGPAGVPLPSTASARVDPLRVDSRFGDGGVDPRALGPFKLTNEQRKTVRRNAAGTGLCVTDTSRVPRIEPRGCIDFTGEPPTSTQVFATNALMREARPCLRRTAFPDYALDAVPDVRAAIRSTPRPVRRCLFASLRGLLAPSVAPAALLFLVPAAAGARGVDLADADPWRIALVAALVLLLTFAVTTAVTVRTSRPLRRLHEAVRSSGDDAVPVPVTTRDEVGRLTEAFNDLSARRAETDRQRRAMVHDIAHELRGPVTNMRSWLEGAEDGLVPSDAELRTAMLDEAVQLQHIVTDLADLAAADAGELALHPEPLAVADVVRQVVDAHRAAALAAGVALDAHVDGDPSVLADPVRLRQVLGNLVGNALGHTPRGGRVDVTVTGGDAVSIAVADTGTGIRPEDLPHVFDRFWRADRSRQRTAGRGGSGLGLSIVQQLAQAHGGRVTAESTPGEGSVFTLRLPADD